MKTSPFRKHQSFQSGTGFGVDTRLNLVEREFHKVMGSIEDRLMHHGDRPQIEAQIMAFLNRAQGPSTEGIAAAMGISPDAAEIHLRALSDAHRVWSQPAHGNHTAWYLSNEGRAYLLQRGRRQIASAL